MNELILIFLLIPSICLAQDPWGQAANAFGRGFQQQMGQPVQPSYQDQQTQFLQQQYLQGLIDQQRVQKDWALEQQYNKLPESNYPEPVARPAGNQRYRTNCVTIGAITSCN